MSWLLLLACAPSPADSGATEAPVDCSEAQTGLTLGWFPEGTGARWRAYGDGESLCFRTGPSGNGSTWPEIRVVGRSGRGHLTARLVRDGELLYEIEYDEAMSRPSDDLCAYTSHFYLWLPVEVIDTFDGQSAVLGALYEDAETGEGVLQDTVDVVPTVCNPEDELP